MYLLAAVLPLVLIIAALADIITRDDSQVKHLPKMVWILLVVLLPFVGSILWFAIGREYAARGDRGTFGDPRRWGSPVESSSAVGSSAFASSVAGAGRGRSTEEELADLEREIEFHENQERIRLLEAEIEERRKRSE
ncbi:phospholipase D-like protein [Glaciihabitans tibetensis]|uniref:Phospholipase D-like protein n=1 Tax=Glaciihabitans tibetensis TaxID=1266600 RepID=A0A2T0VBH0_9MICO|nr:PLD nuclease N-terminal domain-containing protein [Glaciihabitans tibetensis]PRY67511.1 phospholipase D-like protein [Glaciihabitans tibetensis]